MALGPRINHLAWHSISRRHFLGAAAATAGALATGLRIPNVLADNDQLATVFPLPIPGTIQPFPDLPAIHHFPPVLPNPPFPINEPSQITDFKGAVGVCRVKGTGIGSSGQLNYQVDNGFMNGTYLGEDGRVHSGTFAFI